MNKKHILIIEDDTGIQAVTQFSLEIEEDWQVTTALRGKKGLLKAKNLHPDVILLDIVMPDINGLEIIKELQNNQATKKIPIILFTAKAMGNDILKLQNSGVIGIITKPFDCLTLSATISNILDRQCRLV
ncbi:MAG: response regulator [Xenococcaceae cyanobacterium MO_188.B29]|nr:response regulator [Xenococcaceae cyanobacterium MO_188.B29]